MTNSNETASEPVTTYYLEMTSPDALNYKQNPEPTLMVMECEIKQYQVNKYLYEWIGAQWQWFDKLTWTVEQWKAYAENDNLRTWVAYKSGSPAGYYELQYQADDNVEIAYFGLVDRFFGKGYGGFLLSHAIASGFEWGAKRVWVHTCTLDHPSALRNYQARGLKIYREEISEWLF